MDTSQYIEMFIDESKENLQEMNQILLDLENQPDNLELLDAIFRIAHTIKGMAGTMSYTKITNLTHKMENVMHEVRSGKIKVTEETVDILFECFDALEEYVENLVNTGKEGTLNTDNLINKLSQILGGDPVAEVALETDNTLSSEGFQIKMDEVTKGTVNEALREAYNVFLIDVQLNETCMLKSARSFIVFNKLGDLGDIIATYPETEKIEEEEFDLNFELLYITKLDAKAVHKEIMSISEIEDIVLEAVDTKFEVETTAATSETSTATATKTKNQLKKSKSSQTVRVDIGRLDNLMNLVSELIIIKTRLEDGGSKADRGDMHGTIEYLEQITTSLHDAVMKVRMVPVERTFNRFPRMVRDLSKELGKGINLIMSGEDTEVDRTVIDEIGDPLIHLIRNSLDHGIEPKEERLAAGKPEDGTVNLRAYPDGNTVVIEVEDDGKGINSEKIKEKAIDKGVITKEEATTLSPKEATNLLFRPGFSTVDVVTDLSGRGVGLDVVQQKIESLNGTVEIDSEVGVGSKFTIRLPLTLAIIQALMIKLKEEQYAIPLNNIKEITTIDSENISLIQSQEVVLYRGNTLPLLRLGDILSVDGYEEETGNMTVVILRKGDEEVGVVVNELVGQQEIVIKSLGKYLKGLDIIAGATILGNGGVSLIIDPNKLF